MKEENVRVIGPLMFDPYDTNFIEDTNKISRTKMTENSETLENKILNKITDCFQNRVDSLAEGGRQVGLSEKEIAEILSPVNKLLEAYTASIDIKAHMIVVLIESMLTIILATPNRLSEFTESVQNSFQKIAMEEITKKIENIKEEKK
jgi:hypothetical protein